MHAAEADPGQSFPLIALTVHLRAMVVDQLDAECGDPERAFGVRVDAGEGEAGEVVKGGDVAELQAPQQGEALLGGG